MMKSYIVFLTNLREFIRLKIVLNWYKKCIFVQLTLNFIN